MTTPTPSGSSSVAVNGVPIWGGVLGSSTSPGASSTVTVTASLPVKDSPGRLVSSAASTVTW